MQPSVATFIRLFVNYTVPFRVTLYSDNNQELLKLHASDFDCAPSPSDDYRVCTSPEILVSDIGSMMIWTRELALYEVQLLGPGDAHPHASVLPCADTTAQSSPLASVMPSCGSTSSVPFLCLKTSRRRVWVFHLLCSLVQLACDTAAIVCSQQLTATWDAGYLGNKSTRELLVLAPPARLHQRERRDIAARVEASELLVTLTAESEQSRFRHAEERSIKLQVCLCC